MCVREKAIARGREFGGGGADGKKKKSVYELINRPAPVAVQW